ncbi:hypothetical protein PRUPE_1G312800 [Prunus persica]|uniref:Uncharacterized protein n=1 Tax=Prunus persica TaxID=3760 RepID=A0A251R8K7_PRUPE|nr:hypothetical protein PRUPE_1G312800 [Prunus persica]
MYLSWILILEFMDNGYLDLWLWFGYVETRTPLTGCYRRPLPGSLLCVSGSPVPRLDGSSLATGLLRIPPCGSAKRSPCWIVFPQYMYTIICTSPVTGNLDRDTWLCPGHPWWGVTEFLCWAVCACMTDI